MECTWAKQEEKIPSGYPGHAEETYHKGSQLLGWHIAVTWLSAYNFYFVSIKYVTKCIAYVIWWSLLTQTDSRTVSWLRALVSVDVALDPISMCPLLMELQRVRHAPAHDNSSFCYGSLSLLPIASISSRTGHLVFTCSRLIWRKERWKHVSQVAIKESDNDIQNHWVYGLCLQSGVLNN